MKKLAVLLALMMALLMLTGCKKSDIQGDWKDATGTVYSFKADMTFAIDTGSQIAVGGTFSIAKDSDQVIFTMTAPAGTTVTSQATFTLSADGKTLTFTGADGTVTQLTKK
jgi:outer membrane lipoprotein-sorting protein